MQSEILRGELVIKTGPHHRMESGLNGTLVFLRTPQPNGSQISSPLICKPGHLPFRSSSCTYRGELKPVKSAAEEGCRKELERAAFLVPYRPIIFEKLPMLGRVATAARRLRQGDEGARRWNPDFAEDLFKHRLIENPKDLVHYQQNLEKHHINGNLIAIDYFFASLLRAAGARALNALLSAEQFVSTGDPIQTIGMTILRELVTPALMENSYVLFRYLTMEYPALARQLHEGTLSESEVNEIKKSFYKLMGLNCIFLLPYLWSDLISAGNNSAIFHELRKLTEIKSLEKFRLRRLAEKLRLYPVPYDPKKENELLRLK